MAQGDSVSKMDIDRPPSGEGQLRAVVDAIIESGDDLESDYLENKSSLDFSSKEDCAKVAKFILGAANRSPEIAEKHFKGFAVMVIGVAEGKASGIARGTERHQLSDKIQKYLGSDGPGWDLQRIPASNSDHEILFVVVDPPKSGCQPFLCRGAGEGVEDGAIYLRDRSQTKKATASQIDAMFARQKQAASPEPDLELNITEPLWFISKSRDELKSWLRTSIEQARVKYVRERSLEDFAILGTMASPKVLTESEFEEQAAAWSTRMEPRLAKSIDETAGATLPPTVFVLRNKSTVFMKSIRLEIIVHQARSLDWSDSERLDLGELFPPVIDDSQFKSDFFRISDYSSLIRGILYTPKMAAGAHGINSYRFYDDADHVHLEAEFTTLRPDSQWSWPNRDLVLLPLSPEAESLKAEWSVTAEGYDRKFAGELLIPVKGSLEISELISHARRKAKNRQIEQ